MLRVWGCRCGHTSLDDGDLTCALVDRQWRYVEILELYGVVLWEFSKDWRLDGALKGLRGHNSFAKIR